MLQSMEREAQRGLAKRCRGLHHHLGAPLTCRIDFDVTYWLLQRRIWIEFMSLFLPGLSAPHLTLSHSSSQTFNYCDLRPWRNGSPFSWRKMGHGPGAALCLRWLGESLALCCSCVCWNGMARCSSGLMGKYVRDSCQKLTASSSSPGS